MFRKIGIGCMSLIGLVVAIGVIVAVVDDGEDISLEGDVITEDMDQNEPAAKEDEPKSAAIGDSVRDGKFEFTVLSVKTGVKSIGAEFMREKPQGQFVLVKVKVENIGDEAQYLSASDQYLFDAAGRKHSADDDVWLVMDDNPLLEQINPGNEVTGTVVFDIPVKAKPERLELHDSMFSGGVEVALTS